MNWIDSKGNVSLDQGSTMIYLITVAQNGVVKDLTGLTATAKVRKGWQDGSGLLDLPITITILTPATAGQFIILIDSDDSAVPSGSYYWDVSFATSDSPPVVIYETRANFTVNSTTVSE